MNKFISPFQLKVFAIGMLAGFIGMILTHLGVHLPQNVMAHTSTILVEKAK